jgi:uncharacterized protein YndB with AHSA1/START domain
MISFMKSKKLFVDKTIGINASAAKVWDALTKPECTDLWTGEFSPEFRLESDWQLGHRVEWKDSKGKVCVEGEVTALKPGKMLRYTVADTRAPRVLMKEGDGITYELAEDDGRTTLRILQGDFSGMEHGEKYCRMTAETWDRVLPKVKAIAENR